MSAQEVLNNLVEYAKLSETFNKGSLVIAPGFLSLHQEAVTILLILLGMY